MGCALVPWKQRENLTVGGHLASPFLSSRGCPRIPGVAWVYVARAVRSARSGDPSVVLHWLVRKGKEKSGVPTAVPVNAIMFRRWQTHSVLLTARRNRRVLARSSNRVFSSSRGEEEVARRISRFRSRVFGRACLFFRFRGNGIACVDRTFRAYTQRQS